MFELTKRDCNKYFGHMEDFQYKHYNKALGCMIYSKEHFISEMNRRGLIPYDVAMEKARQWDKENPRKEYKLSVKAQEIIKEMRLSADGNGNISLGGRAIKALKDIGAIVEKKDIDYIRKKFNGQEALTI